MPRLPLHDQSKSQSFIGDTLIAEALQEGTLSEPERAVADPYISGYKVHQIAAQLSVSRREVSHRIWKLKRQLWARWKKSRESLVNARGDDLELSAPPEHIAIDQHIFRSGDREQTVYLIARDDELTWVDGKGFAFPDEIQDILNDLPTEDFEVLNVE